MIAQYPLEKRSESKLLVLDRSTGIIEHCTFYDIRKYLRKDDVMVINKTRVIAARLFGKKTTGAVVEIFLLNQKSETCWECLVKPGRRLKPGSRVKISDKLQAEVISNAEDGARIIRFQYKGDFFEILDSIGKMPLPPYIHREATEHDKITYQTVYAASPGSVAAPTAGLHFTSELLQEIAEMGVIIAQVELNVGLGTFRPVKAENISEHVMHSEYCSISEEVAEVINKAKAEKRRVISVGTTSTRTLESFAEGGRVRSGSHHTDLFIYPGGRKFEIIDVLLTNFHLPESTLLMLVSSFASYENTMRAYESAIRNNYRFFSYGDAMLII